jgi:hypothetical protein
MRGTLSYVSKGRKAIGRLAKGAGMSERIKKLENGITEVHVTFMDMYAHPSIAGTGNK